MNGPLEREPCQDGGGHEETPMTYARPSLRARVLHVAMARLVRPVNRRLMRISPVHGLRISSRLLGLSTPESRPDRHALRDIGGVPCDVLMPRRGRPRRTVLYLHGGGFVIHSPPFFRHWGRRLAERLQAEVIIPDYRLAPRHRHPAAGDDCQAVYNALLAEGRDPTAIAIAGDSAGGNLVLATLLRLRDNGDPLPACAVPISPATDLLFRSASLKTNHHRDAMVLADALPGLCESYVDPRDAHHHYISPVNGDFTGLPPLAIMVGGTEVLLDDSRRVAAIARAAGVPTELYVWPGMPHCFPLFHFLPEARQALEVIARFVLQHTRPLKPETTSPGRQA